MKKFSGYKRCGTCHQVLGFWEIPGQQKVLLPKLHECLHPLAWLALPEELEELDSLEKALFKIDGFSLPMEVEVSQETRSGITHTRYLNEYAGYALDEEEVRSKT